ncbi:hypothetical protein LPB86_17730 [Pedobacter sp. MC2016-14]|uniref:hypothetical protein n=1 Tax=Pedobacter sp. MC2016-14 TaxID=2897327 RepID=UPI001E29D5F7|nr:hypothetical protein [Pedobacter sp. MC2016-14]MCD0490086.1 hypothetical protein [Pedobacter sp. MC2016-14]
MKNSRIKKILTLSVSLLIIAFARPVMAQSKTAMKNKTPEERAQFQTNLLKEKLSLDSGQAVQLNKINLKYAQKNEPIINGNGSKFSKLKELKDLQKQKDAELKNIFTADQYKQYQALQAEMKDKIKSQLGRN